MSDVDAASISPRSWRLLRVAAGYDQRGVERELREIRQAHVSMLESGSRSLSRERRRALLDLYAAELERVQIDALVAHF